jgi:hypothetical protein
LYSGLGHNFNDEIKQVNQSILLKDYHQAHILILLIENRYIFKNESVYRTKVLLSIKQPTNFVYSNLNSTEDYIIKSMILGQTNHPEESRLILKEGLKLFPEKDSLIKLYELFSFISQRNLYQSLNYEDHVTVNKISVNKDAKWMLDLLRKNEKFLPF